MKFQRDGHHQRQTQTDLRGRVSVLVRLYDPSKRAYLKGNLTRTISVKDATVSEVVAAVEQALFGEEDRQT